MMMTAAQKNELWRGVSSMRKTLIMCVGRGYTDKGGRPVPPWGI